MSTYVLLYDGNTAIDGKCDKIYFAHAKKQLQFVCFQQFAFLVFFPCMHKALTSFHHHHWYILFGCKTPYLHVQSSNKEQQTLG